MAIHDDSCLLIYLLMHQPFVTTNPKPLSRVGDSRANAVFLLLHFPHSAGGNVRDLIYKHGSATYNMTDCGEQMPWFYQFAAPLVWGL